MFGWWQTVKAADLDGDGDNDLVLGNMAKIFISVPISTSCKAVDE